jgi:hypothetical protein
MTDTAGIDLFVVIRVVLLLLVPDIGDEQQCERVRKPVSITPGAPPALAGQSHKQGRIHEQPRHIDGPAMLHPGRSRARRVMPRTTQAAVASRWATIWSLSAASSASRDEPSKTASTSPADRCCAAATNSATVDRNSPGLAASMAAVAEDLSSTGTGSSSPAIATSMAALSKLALVPKSTSTVGTEAGHVAAHCWSALLM